MARLKPKVGIYAGTFDPVHEGHVAFALRAVAVCDLEKVVMIPEQVPRGKHGVSHIGTRLALLRLKTAQRGELEVQEVATPQLTLANLPELVDDDYSVSILVGSDVMRSVIYWKGIKDKVASLEFIVALRNDDTHERMESVFSELEATIGASVQYTIFDSPHRFLASSQMR